jgi:hypothetical protein
VLRVNGRLAPDSTLTRFTVEVQLKATQKTPIEQNGRYSHSLDARNYNDLRSIEALAPQLLVVLYLPEDAEAWLTHGEEGLIARRCGYWASLLGAPETEQGSKTVYVPRANVLSVSRLRELMTQYSREEVITYDA